MQIVENTHVTEPTVSRNWKKNKEAFSGDDLIDAYLKGKEAGKNEKMRILFNQFKGNIEKATSLSENLYEFACKKDIKLKEIHLKAEDITRFAALFVADKNNFLSDNFRELYIHAREIKKIAETEDFYISFSFMPASEKINESCLITDGYFLKYEKK